MGLPNVFEGMERGHGVHVTLAWHELVMQALLSCHATALCAFPYPRVFACFGPSCPLSAADQLARLRNTKQHRPSAPPGAGQRCCLRVCESVQA